MSDFKGVDGVELTKAKHGRPVFADVAFTNDSMAAVWRNE